MFKKMYIKLYIFKYMNDSRMGTGYAPLILKGSMKTAATTTTDCTTFISTMEAMLDINSVFWRYLILRSINCDVR